MKEQFVTYEIALKLKELGFDEECLGFYYSKENELEISIPIAVEEICKKFNAIKAPLWQQVIDWFRDKYDIDIELPYGGNKGKYYVFVKDYVYDKYNKSNPKQFNYGEAREQAILKAIELCQ